MKAAVIVLLILSTSVVIGSECENLDSQNIISKCDELKRVDLVLECYKEQNEKIKECSSNLNNDYKDEEEL